MRSGRTQYTQATGLPELRERIARWYGTRFGLDIAPAAHRDHRRRLGRAAAGLPGAVRARRRGADARPQLPLQPAFRRRRRGHGTAAAGAARGALPARCRRRARALERAHPRRAAGLALQPHRHLDRARRDGGHRRGGARARRRHAGRRDLPGPELRRSLRPQRAGAWRRCHLHQQLLQVLQHDRLAPGLAGAAERAGGAGRESWRRTSTSAPPPWRSMRRMACFDDASIAEYERRRDEFRRRRDFVVPALQAMGLQVPVHARRRLLCLGRLQRASTPAAGTSAST